MNRIIIVIMTVVMLFAFVACSKGAAESAAEVKNTETAQPVASVPAAATPSTGTVDSEYDPNVKVEFETQTNADRRVVTIGTIDKSRYIAPILVTSFGQSTDAAMLDTVMKRVGVDYTYNPTVGADGVAGYKTIVIAVGASTKGLGAAGISEADETARAKAIMKEVEAHGLEVICCHIGGSSRRGALSDVFTDMVLSQSSCIVLKEDANFDGKFTDYAKAHNLPISLIFATKDTVQVFTEIFK